MPDLKEAKRLLEKATTECKTAKDVADKHGSYVAAKKRTQEACAELRKLPADQKALIAKELEAVDAQIELATAKAETEHKPGDAIAILTKAQKDLDQARIKTDMHANLNSPAPNAEFVKLLVKESGGTKVLDDMVAQMSDKTNRHVLEIALEARFNVDLQQYLSQDGITIGTPPNERTVHGTADNTAPDKSVKRIYEMLLKVPESHARDNPLVREIQRFQEDTGGAAYYHAGPERGRIDLNVGRAGASTSTNQGAQLCSPEYFPDGVDEDCQPPAEAKNKDVRYFDWATLHEVGHAVDDKNKFMEKNMSGGAFGGWKAYGDNVTEVAKAAQKKFKYDLDYIKDRLAWGAPEAATKPADRTADDWKKAQETFDNWCDTIMNLRLWWDGQATKRVAIDGRVYQLAYGDKDSGYVDYVSYNLEARKQGIHGYQFRAPGEWFAELYAAYYMEMLKPEHPAVKDWLPAKLK